MLNLKINRLRAAYIDLMIASIIPVVTYVFFCDVLSIDLFYPCIGLGYIFLFIKDFIFKKISIGKRIMKINVRMIDDSVPSNFILFLRNLTYIIYPIEVVMIILFNKRLTDIIFKTKVVEI